MFRNVRTRSKDSPVTFETWKMGQMRCETNWVAVSMVSFLFLMKMGILRAPGDLRIRVSWVIVCSRIWGGQMSILVITTMTGTLSARAMPRCSLRYQLDRGIEGMGSARRTCSYR